MRREIGETAMSAIIKELERAQQGFDKSCESIKDGKFSPYAFQWLRFDQ